MNFGKNLQVLRKMTIMTQEELAEKMNVSRQTVSKWELGSLLPGVEKLVDLCEMFDCSVDQLLRDNMDFSNEAYSDIRIVTVEPFRYISYSVISREPEEDAIAHAEGWAKYLKIENPYIIGWNFPKVSKEQRNVFHMHGYKAALILEDEQDIGDIDTKILSQNRQKYITMKVTDFHSMDVHTAASRKAAAQWKFTLEEVQGEEATVIPNAYKALRTYMAINRIKEKHEPAIISCYEHEYFDNKGVKFMDIYIAIE